MNRSSRLRESVPPVHVALVVACSLVFVAERVQGVSWIDRFAMFGPAVADGEVFRLLSAGFVHVDGLHLVMNMLGVLFLGRALEPVLSAAGWWRFPLLYVGSLLAGSCGVLLLEYSSAAVGASGAVYGLLGAAVTLPLRLGLGWNRLGVAPWIALNLMFTFAVPGISVGGHLGGLAGGLVLGWVLAPRRLSLNP